MIEDTYRDGAMLRRWHVLDGRARCPLDGAAVNRLSRADQAAILAANQAVRDRIALVDAYEAALRLRAGEEPPETIDVTAEDGTVTAEPNPAYAEWLAAEETIVNASSDTLALHQKRLGFTVETIDGEDVQVPFDPDPLPADTITLLDPMPASVTPLQARVALASIGRLAEVDALVSASDATVQAAWAHANALERHSPMLNALAAALVPPLSDDELDDVFRAAAKVTV